MVEILFGACWNGWFITSTRDVAPPDRRPSEGADQSDVDAMINWMRVLAIPHLFKTLRRRPNPDHLVRLLDIYIAHAQRGAWGRRCSHEDSERLMRREPLARELRALLSTWAPCDLPPEITETAREVLDAEHVEPPEGGWDAFVNKAKEPLEDVLMWPEGIPWVLRTLAEHPVAGERHDAMFPDDEQMARTATAVLCAMELAAMLRDDTALAACAPAEMRAALVRLAGELHWLRSAGAVEDPDGRIERLRSLIDAWDPSARPTAMLLDAAKHCLAILRPTV